LRELVAFFTREPKPDARVVHPSVSARRVLEFTGLMAMFGVTE
jgi:hypothetical protein